MNEIPINEICWQVQVVCIAVAGPVIAVLVVAYRQMRRQRMADNAIKDAFTGLEGR